VKLTHILQPITINRLEIKNRVFRPGHGTYYGQGGISDALIAYHEARARAGVGLSTLEVCCVHPSTSSNRTIYGWSDSIIPDFQRIASAMHRHGMKLFVQVWHGGHHWPNIDGSPPWSASDVPSPWGFVPVPMSRDQIGEIVQSFAATARRAQEGGLDGVEMHMGHGYLVHQYFSPITNVRQDEYGGSLQNRARFGREILSAVRKAVGPDFPVGIRISDSHVPGGVTADECADIVRSYCGDRLLDFVNASMGSYYDVPSMLPAMDTPTGAMVPSSGRIAAAASGKVVSMVVGRYRTLEEADQAIRDGIADIVGINRAMIADSDLVTKTLAGQGERVRPCIGCNQGCVGGILSAAPHMACTVNPTVGYESTLGEHLIVKAPHTLKVVVVGGGPAGMEAARVAALSGHKVVLFEAQSRLAGALNIAKKAPKSAQIGDIGVWLEQELYHLGVDVRLSCYAESGDVLAERPDAVIVATGSMPRMDGFQASAPGLPTQGVAQPHVYTSTDIYNVPRENLGQSAVVFDDVGHYEALGVAEYLIVQGLAVTFVTRFASLAPKIDAIQRLEPVLRRLRRGEFSLRVRGRVVQIGATACKLGWLDGDQVDVVPASTVVLVGYTSANTAVYDELVNSRGASQDMQLKIIGDAASPRDLQVAIREGHMAGRFL
jgi:2,4-dienoyl-CoA reductase-like NADH-dependent reductase (Old Yellow Enzyme family)/threonine dehydrogenase-like Zn-dependent dehydrogenase